MALNPLYCHWLSYCSVSPILLLFPSLCKKKLVPPSSPPRKVSVLFICVIFSFLVYCFILFPYFCLFVSLPCIFAFVWWKEQHQTIKLENVFFPSILSVSLVSCLVLSFKSLFLVFVFLILSCVSRSTAILSFQEDNMWNTNLGWSWGLGEKLSFLKPNFGWC